MRYALARKGSKDIQSKLDIVHRPTQRAPGRGRCRELLGVSLQNQELRINDVTRKKLRHAPKTSLH